MVMRRGRGCCERVGETWFSRDGHVFQLSVSAPDREMQDFWIREIANKLTFPDAGPEGTSTEL